jgi:diguanylate cyclase (GGDEF)-like protein
MRVLFVVLGALLAGYVTWLAVEPHFHYSPIVNGWALDSFEVLVAVLCMTRALRSGLGRGAALALGAGLLSWAIGDIVYTTETLAKASDWGATWADLFWLGFYPPAYVGVVLFMRREVRKIADPSWLDGTVAALGAAAVCAAFAFAGLNLTGASTLTAATYIAYPIGDLLLFALVVGSATVLSRRTSAPWVFLASAMALNALGDTFNLFQSSLATPRVDAVFRALAWPAAGLLVLVAVWLRPRPHDPLASERPAGFALPGTAATAALGVLFVGAFHHVTRVALVLAGATMVAVGVRLVLSTRRLRAFTAERLQQSITDDLTGLRNRRYLTGVLDACFAEHDGHRSAADRLALLYIDLDRFKVVNDSFGHAAGDELLKQLGPRLTRSLRDREVLVRLGGDEFGVLVLGKDADDAGVVARRLITEIEKPFVLEGIQARVGASIGIAYAPDDAGDGEELLRCADVAMYRAKLSESSFALYDAEIDGEGNLWRLSDELRLAIENRQLELHYQPQLDLRREVFSAAEALVRWPHPRLGMVPPDRFIPLAEEAGLMPALTDWVLETGLDQCLEWRNAGEQITVSINVSPTNLLAPGFVNEIRDMLAARHLPSDALVLEITETSIIANLDRAKQVVNELRDLGVVVSIDDFGAGFTSLAYLSDLAVGELKLDGTFIAALSTPDSGRDLDLVRATIELGHTMGMRVVAECIEDQPTLDLLRQFGCDLGQGYLICRPGPADRLPLAGERPHSARGSLTG